MPTVTRVSIVITIQALHLEILMKVVTLIQHSFKWVFINTLIVNKLFLQLKKIKQRVVLQGDKLELDLQDFNNEDSIVY